MNSATESTLTDRANQTCVCSDCGRYIDVDDCRYHAADCPRTFTARLDVYAPCDCGCMRTAWFYCTRLDSRWIAGYLVPGIEYTDRASDESRQEIQSKHPGCVVLNLAP